MSTSEVTPTIVQGKKERRNGDGTTFFDRKRDRWVASFYDINGIRRTQTFHKKNDADKWRIENITQRALLIGTEEFSCLHVTVATLYSLHLKLFDPFRNHISVLDSTHHASIS